MNNAWLFPAGLLGFLCLGIFWLVLFPPRWHLWIAAKATGLSALAGLLWFIVGTGQVSNGTAAHFANLVRWSPLTAAWTALISTLLFLGTLLLGFEIKEPRERTRVLTLWLISGVGLLSVALANHLLIVLIAWPLASLPLTLAASGKRRAPRISLAVIATYFADFLSFLMLAFGITLLFAQYQSLHLETLMEAVRSDSQSSDILLYTGMALWFAAFLTRIAAFPFHIVTSERLLTGSLAIGGLSGILLPLSAAAFGWNFLGEALKPLMPQWQTFLAWLGLLTLWGGSLGMLVQKGTRSFLASALILQGGWILLLIAIPSPISFEAESFFQALSTSAALYILLFTAVILEKNLGTHTSSGLVGLFQDRPRLAWATLTAYLTLACVPFTSGFTAKAMVLARLANREVPLLAIVAALAIVVAAIPCLKAIGTMASKGQRLKTWPEPAGAASLLLWWLAMGLWVLGICPSIVWPG